MKFLDQIRDLKIPLPTKNDILNEIQSDTCLAENDRGAPLEFIEEDLKEFYSVHNNALFKFLDQFSETIKEKIETSLVVFPVVSVFLFLGKERFMIDFIRDGGWGMLAILGLGLPLLVRESLGLFRLAVIKDHCAKNLRLDTPSVQLGCLALISLGLAGTGLGIYYTASAVISHPEYQNLFVQGLKESVGNIILSSSFASVILIIHFTSRRLLIRWNIQLPL